MVDILKSDMTTKSELEDPGLDHFYLIIMISFDGGLKLLTLTAFVIDHHDMDMCIFVWKVVILFMLMFFSKKINRIQIQKPVSVMIGGSIVAHSTAHTHN